MLSLTLECLCCIRNQKSHKQINNLRDVQQIPCGKIHASERHIELEPHKNTHENSFGSGNSAHIQLTMNLNLNDPAEMN